MVDGRPEESLTGPFVVGKWRKMTFMVSTGTEI
jgi:hypothetical protein